MKVSHDAIVVGHGLAGAVLSRVLQQQGKSVIVFDPNQANTSSKIAAGLINPVTGRRFALSWKFDRLNEHARKFYASWESEINDELVYPFPLIRAVEDSRFLNDIEAKTADPTYSLFIENYLDALPDYFNAGNDLYQIRQAYRVDIKKLIQASRNQLLKLNALFEIEFNHDQLQINDEGINYDQWSARHIFFCEGYRGASNPWFGYLPFKLTKGEILQLHHSDLKQIAYKRDLILMPTGPDALWCGTLNFWDFADDQPTVEGERILIEKLRRIYSRTIHIHDHLAAIRPTIRDRRPLLGCHPKHNSLVIFNGLGTKGALLAPYFANQLVAHVYAKNPIDKEAHINRFLDRFPVG